MIELANISKQFGAIRAVDNVSLNITPGRILGFMGPNGAGKTTTIRMLMNIIHPDSGLILFDGNKTRPPANRIGYLPEERGLYQKISVQETLEYFAHLRKVKDVNRKIQNYLNQFELGERSQAKVSELSKGNQQKLQFINTILHDPQVLILDEPFSGLDPVNQLLLKEILEEKRVSGKTIIFSSHQMDQVERLCDDVALINKGKLVLFGPLDEIKKTYGATWLQFTPENIDDLKHPYFSDKQVHIRKGSAFFHLAQHDKRKLTFQLNDLFDMRSISVVEPGLEDIFIMQVKGDPE